MEFYTKRLSLIVLFLFYFLTVKAAKVDTVNTFSPSMNKTIKAIIITPNTYKKSKKPFAVVYLLHGHGGNYTNWITNAPELKNLVDQSNIIVVCPDGNTGSWYFDSPIDTTYKYETYVSNELVSWVDKNYKTIKDRSGRGITGLSMGGHGALYLAFKHQDVFGVAGSMSGGVDFRPFPLKWQIAKRLGTLKDNPERWDQYTVFNMINLLKPNSLELIIDCGTEDFFYDVNNSFHQKLLENKIPHSYIVRPGAHNWAYWKNAVAYQLLFMYRYFNKL